MTVNHGFAEEDDEENGNNGHTMSSFYLEQGDEATPRPRVTSDASRSQLPPTPSRAPAKRMKSVSDTEIVTHGTDARASFQRNVMRYMRSRNHSSVQIEKEGTQTNPGSRRPSLFQTLRQKIAHKPVTDFGIGESKDLAGEDSEPTSCCCTSWTRFVDTMGNRQTKFCKKLRQLRPCLIDAKLALIKFGAELERELRPGPDDVCTKIADAINDINSIICDSSLNIPPHDSSQMRLLTDELAILLRVCTEVYDHWQLIQSLQHKPTIAHSSSQPSLNGADLTVETKEGIDAIEKIDKVHSLKERITRNVNMIELQLIFIDNKCERRWWLKDLIRVLQAVMKLLVFISASISVAYHKDQGFPIATLVLTIAQGIIDMFDQLFVQRFNPKDINLQTSAKTGRKPVAS